MSANKLKLEDLQIKGFVTDLSASKKKTHNYRGGYCDFSGWGSCGGGGGGTGPTLRCDDWTDDEGTRHCTDNCESDYCHTEYPGC